MELTHAQIEELLGAYALDAVEEDEADLVERHLRACPRCRAEVAEHREVAAALGQVGAPAPAGLWGRIAAQLEEPPPQLDMARVVALHPPRRSVPARLVAAMTAVAAAVIAVLGVGLYRMDDRQDELAAAVQRNGLDRAVQAALLDPAARRVSLRSGDGRTFLQAVVRGDGSAYLVDDNLPRLTGDRTYQLWAISDDRPDQPVSVGLLGPDPGVAAVQVAGRDVTALAVTSERAGGGSAPTGDPVVSGTLA